MKKRKLTNYQNLKLKELQVINEQRITLYEEAWKDTQRELTKEKFSGNLKGIGGFWLG